MISFGKNLEMGRNQKMWQKLSILVAMINVITGLSTQIVRSELANLGSQWRLMTTTEEEQNWEFIINSPLGIAALNQLAIEGFISPVCNKNFYTNDEFGGFQTLLQVNCPTPRGVSNAVSYQEMRVIFSRFEQNIENFTIERIFLEK